MHEKQLQHVIYLHAANSKLLQLGKQYPLITVSTPDHNLCPFIRSFTSAQQNFCSYFFPKLLKQQRHLPAASPRPNYKLMLRLPMGNSRCKVSMMSGLLPSLPVSDSFCSEKGENFVKVIPAFDVRLVRVMKFVY